jgi:hypothetical protein
MRRHSRGIARSSSCHSFQWKARIHGIVIIKDDYLPRGCPLLARSACDLPVRVELDDIHGLPQVGCCGRHGEHSTSETHDGQIPEGIVGRSEQKDAQFDKKGTIVPRFLSHATV